MLLLTCHMFQSLLQPIWGQIFLASAVFGSVSGEKMRIDIMQYQLMV